MQNRNNTNVENTITTSSSPLSSPSPSSSSSSSSYIKPDLYWEGITTATIAGVCIIIILLLFIATAISCQKPILCTGPRGPMGQTGANTSAFMNFSSGIVNILNGNIIGTGYVVNQSQELSAVFTVPRSCILSRLYVLLSTAPSLSNGRDFIVRVNGIPSALTVNITGSNTNGFNIVNSVNVNQFDQISLQTLTDGTPLPSICEAVLMYT
jgi:hypothetical protein